MNVKMEMNRNMQNTLQAISYSENLFYDGEYTVQFDIIQVFKDRREALINVYRAGKNRMEYVDLHEDEDGDLYFEYGLYLNRVYIDEELD